MMYLILWVIGILVSYTIAMYIFEPDKEKSDQKQMDIIMSSFFVSLLWPVVAILATAFAVIAGPLYGCYVLAHKIPRYKVVKDGEGDQESDTED